MIDLDRISKLTGFVDKLIQLKGIEDALDEEKISELIQDAINYSHADYSGEEIDSFDFITTGELINAGSYVLSATGVALKNDSSYIQGFPDWTI